MTLPFGHGELLKWLESKLVADVVAQTPGVDPAKVQAVVTQVASTHPLLQLLLSANWQSIVALIIQLLALVG